MTALASYSTGTISVSADGTTVTGTSTLWLTAGNAKPGDRFQAGHFTVDIVDVTDNTHLTITPWPGTTLAGAAYAIWKVSPQRIVGASAAADVDKLVGALNTSGYFVFVSATATVPDPSLGDDGQFAFQPATGKTWSKSSGVWNYLGIYKGFNLAGAWSGATGYNVGDVVTSAGSSYVCILAHTNQAPPNATYWQLLASVGSPGATGSTGAGYGGTSTSSLAIGTGAKAFATQSGLAYQNGARVRAASAANTANWMEGRATYAGSTLTINVDKTGGSGTFADWILNLAGEPGTGDLSSSAQSLTATQQAQARANIAVQKKNYIVNGGMQISQENGTTAGTTNGYYPADQWTIANGSTVTFSAAQVAVVTPGGSSNRLRVTATSAVTPASGAYFTLRQKIEGLRTSDLLFGSAAAKTVTLQFGCKGPAGTYGVAIFNGAVSRCYVGQFTIAAGEANSDVVKSVSIAGDTAGTWAIDNSMGLAVEIVLTSAGSIQAAPGAWASAQAYTNAQTNFFGTNGNVFELFDVGLYEGPVAPAFQLPDYVAELLLCQRYYQLVTWGLEAYASAALQRYQSTVSFVPKRTSAYSVQRKQAPSANTNIRGSDTATYVQIGAITKANAHASISAESAAAGLMQAYTIVDAINDRL